MADRISVIPSVSGLSLPRHHGFVIMTMLLCLWPMHTPAARGNPMRFVPIPGRESFRARLEHQIDNLKVLVRSMGTNSRDLETTGEHVSAALETLDRDGRIEVERGAVPVVRCVEWTSLAEWAALDAAALDAATALQEAIASVDLMRLHAGVASRSDLQGLAGRLARADAAFRLVAFRSRLLARSSDCRCFSRPDRAVTE
jgi:hypothetical protein